MMFCNSSLGKVFGVLVSLLQSVAAIILGLHAFGKDVLNSAFVQTHMHAFVRPLEIAFGIAGILGLVYLFVSCKSACEVAHDHQHPHKR